MSKSQIDGPNADHSLVTHRTKQRGQAQQIALARMRREGTALSRDDFQADPMAPAGEAFEPQHQELRDELRRIIAEDAEKAANETGAPTMEDSEPADLTKTQPRRHSRLKIVSYWLACFLGIGAVAYGLTRPT